MSECNSREYELFTVGISINEYADLVRMKEQRDILLRNIANRKYSLDKKDAFMMCGEKLADWVTDEEAPQE